MSTIERALSRKKKDQKQRPEADARPAEDESAPSVSEPEPEPASAEESAQPRKQRPGEDRRRPTPTGFEPRGPELRIDLHKLQRASMYPPPAMEERLSNEYRRIKRPLVNNASGRGVVQVPYGNLIMLTSSVQGEGKTFTALNLAMSIARDPDFSVTLVDGDTARRDLSHLLGLSEQPGLLDLLADATLDPMDLIMPTNVDMLSVLSAGNRHELSEELLSSERMARLVAQLAESDPHHIILFDAPPVLEAPEAMTLSHHVGQIVMVVKASSTLQHQVTTALDQLAPEKAINMVLNQSLGGPGGDQYGGYYGYGYGEGR